MLKYNRGFEVRARCHDDLVPVRGGVDGDLDRAVRIKLRPVAAGAIGIDIGTAQGCIPVAVALANGHISGGGFDLPPVRPVFEEYVNSFDLKERIAFHEGDFFKQDLPSADVLVMGHILHDWDLDQKKTLLAKAHKALPKGGSLVVYEAMIDDDRRRNVLGLLMSLNMLIETTGGFDYTGADCQGWMKDAGFRETRVEHLAGPDSMVVGVK